MAIKRRSAPKKKNRTKRKARSETFSQARQAWFLIDDLVFVLYFNVLIKEVGINKTNKIKQMCSENKFYKVIG